MYLKLSKIRAHDVPDTDAKKGSAGSDPYVKFTLSVGDYERCVHTCLCRMELPGSTARWCIMCAKHQGGPNSDSDEQCEPRLDRPSNRVGIAF